MGKGHKKKRVMIAIVFIVDRHHYHVEKPSTTLEAFVLLAQHDDDAGKDRPNEIFLAHTRKGTNTAHITRSHRGEAKLLLGAIDTAAVAHENRPRT